MEKYKNLPGLNRMQRKICVPLPDKNSDFIDVTKQFILKPNIAFITSMW